MNIQLCTEISLAFVEEMSVGHFFPCFLNKLPDILNYWEYSFVNAWTTEKSCNQKHLMSSGKVSVVTSTTYNKKKKKANSAPSPFFSLRWQSHDPARSLWLVSYKNICFLSLPKFIFKVIFRETGVNCRFWHCPVVWILLIQIHCCVFIILIFIYTVCLKLAGLKLLCCS